SHSVTLPGLSPQSTYHYRVISRDGAGNVATSSDKTFVTLSSQASTTTALAASPAASSFGQSVTLTATVTPTGADGSVQFFNGAASLGSATLSAGQAQLTVTSLPV